jgi:hypothetical protein
MFRRLIHVEVAEKGIYVVRRMGSNKFTDKIMATAYLSMRFFV